MGLFCLPGLLRLSPVGVVGCTTRPIPRHMSQAVTEVTLTMARRLRRDWRVFTALLLKGSNLESSNSTCEEGKMLKQ